MKGALIIHVDYNNIYTVLLVMLNIPNYFKNIENIILIFNKYEFETKTIIDNRYEFDNYEDRIKRMISEYNESTSKKINITHESIETIPILWNKVIKDYDNIYVYFNKLNQSQYNANLSINNAVNSDYNKTIYYIEDSDIYNSLKNSKYNYLDLYRLTHKDNKLEVANKTLYVDEIITENGKLILKVYTNGDRKIISKLKATIRLLYQLKELGEVDKNTFIICDNELVKDNKCVFNDYNILNKKTNNP